MVPLSCDGAGFSIFWLGPCDGTGFSIFWLGPCDGTGFSIFWLGPCDGTGFSIFWLGSCAGTGFSIFWLESSFFLPKISILSNATMFLDPSVRLCQNNFLLYHSLLAYTA